MAVNPERGLLTQEDLILGKGIETKILMDEISSVHRKELKPIFAAGAKLFNYKLIDIPGRALAEDWNKQEVDIDGIGHILRKQSLMAPVNAAEMKKEKILKKKESMYKELRTPVHFDKNIDRISKVSEEIKDLDEQIKRKELLKDLSRNMQTKPEDKPFLIAFVDYYFEQLIMKEMMSDEEEREVKRDNKTKAIEVQRSVFLEDYMSLLSRKGFR